MADFYESFDNGVGALSHAWGNVDTSVRGQVTLTGNSGMMERPWGADAGHGYGTYTVTAALHGDQVGSAALLWPANDRWPGAEMDFAEIYGGQVYGTMHWNSGGGDSYSAAIYNGVDESKPHTYSIDWQPGKVTLAVDGRVYGSFTDHVGADHAHGGVNSVMGANNINGNASITVYDMSYTASGGGGSYVAAPATTSGTSAPAAAAPAADAPIDWNALAAQVYANYLETGQWFI